MKVDIIVLNYNGEKLLAEYLPSITLASKASSFHCFVKVIDNRSGDDSIGLIKSKFPEVELIVAEDNRVFCSFNKAVKDSSADVVILLNNDLAVDINFVDPLVNVFKKYPDAFFAAPKSYSLDGKYEGGRARIGLKFGMFWASARFKGFEDKINDEGYTFQSGFGAFDRKKFLELNGYDDLYLPGIIEDADLCYRAWKKGYKGYYQPKSVVKHMGQASFKKAFGSEKIMQLAHRNTFLFMWKNITDKRILLKHIIFIPPRLLYSLLAGKPEFFRGFLKAVPKLRQALKRRSDATKDPKMTDREIFRLLKV